MNVENGGGVVESDGRGDGWTVVGGQWLWTGDERTVVGGTVVGGTWWSVIGSECRQVLRGR
jgi:hypothetical protein